MSSDPAPAPPTLADVYREHFRFVWRSLRRLGVRESDTPDAVQEVFLVVHRKLSTFEGRSRMTTWLFGICMRVASDGRRRAHVRREVSVDEEFFDARPDSTRDVARGAQTRNQAEMLERWLAEMPCALGVDEHVRCRFGADNRILTPSPWATPIRTLDYGQVPDGIRLTTGRSHMCVMTTRGTVLCRGKNEWGQLGDGTTEEHDEWREVAGLTDIIAVNAFSTGTCAVTRRGTVLCWGRGGGLGAVTGFTRCEGEPGPEVRFKTGCALAPVEVPALRGARDLSLDYDGGCTLLGDGTITCWTPFSDGQMLRPKVSNLVHLYRKWGVDSAGNVVRWRFDYKGDEAAPFNADELTIEVETIFNVNAEK